MSAEESKDAAPSLESRMTFPEKNGDASEPKPDLEEAQVDGATAPRGGADGLREPEYDVEVKLSDMQQDPNNPLFSAKTFEELNLDPNILKGILSMNFRKPSKIQEKALPLLMANPPVNMIGQSQSGTGKTAAFTLNILSRIDLSNNTPQALVLAPSRELARQIMGVVQTMGQFLTNLQVSAAIPDPNKRGQRYEGQVVVGTPGTVMDMIRKRLLNPQNLKVMVLDEADNMLDQQGLGDQCKRVKMLVPKTVQVVLFSATFADEVVGFAKQFAPNANQLTLRHEELTVEGIKQLYLDCEGEQDKYNVLLKFYGLMTIASSIIFVRTRETARTLAERMTAEGHKVAQLTGALEGNERDAIIDSFRNGQTKVLITTNVLARGIDVQSVTMVINYDIPECRGGIFESGADPETYLHRIGRTGRFGRVGVAISFIHDKGSWQRLHDIGNFFKVDLIPLDTRDWDAVEETIKKTIKSTRAGASTEAMMMDGATS